jgi:hypothetical protein
MRRAFTLLAFFALAACRESSVTPLVDRLEGEYTLRTIDGAPLPYRTTGGDVVADLTSGRLSLDITGNFAMEKVGTQQIGTRPPSTTMEIVMGTWSEGEVYAIKLYAQYPPTSITATYARGEITYSDNGRNYVWRRQKVQPTF